MNFINYKTNKQKVLNFVLTLGWSWRAKNAPKLELERQLPKVFYQKSCS